MYPRRSRGTPRRLPPRQFRKARPSKLRHTEDYTTVLCAQGQPDSPFSSARGHSSVERENHKMLCSATFVLFPIGVTR